MGKSIKKSQETLEMVSSEEIPKETNKEESKIISIYVYNLNGELVKKAPYSDYIEIYEEVVNHNLSNPLKAYNIYPGTQFPPKGFKWDDIKKEFIEKTLEEKVASKETDFVPHPEMKVIGNKVIPKSIPEKIAEGLVVLGPDQIYDPEIGVIRIKNEKENYESGSISYEQLIFNLRNEIKRKYDEASIKSQEKYPISLIQIFSTKRYAAVNWLSIASQEEKKEVVDSDILYTPYSLLLSELNISFDDPEIVNKMDALCKKIIEKANKMDEVLASLSIQFNSYQDKLKEFLALNDKSYEKIEEFKNSIIFNI